MRVSHTLEYILAVFFSKFLVIYHLPIFFAFFRKKEGKTLGLSASSDAHPFLILLLYCCPTKSTIDRSIRAWAGRSRYIFRKEKEISIYARAHLQFHRICCHKSKQHDSSFWETICHCRQLARSRTSHLLAALAWAGASDPPCIVDVATVTPGRLCRKEQNMPHFVESSKAPCAIDDVMLIECNANSLELGLG